MDSSGNGTLDKRELRRALNSLGLGLTIAEGAELFKAVDVDGSGGVSFAEFADICGVACDDDNVRSVTTCYDPEKLPAAPTTFNPRTPSTLNADPSS